jgi:hypothetical protein
VSLSRPNCSTSQARVEASENHEITRRREDNPVLSCHSDLLIRRQREQEEGKERSRYADSVYLRREEVAVPSSRAYFRSAGTRARRAATTSSSR